MPKSQQKRMISVFIASPGDLIDERKQFRQAIDELNTGFADGANVMFEAMGWEDTLATTGRRNQSVINEEIDRCDVFVLVMHRRWGQPAPDAAPYSSYTEEEFHRALVRYKESGAPEIFVFFKRVDPAQEADAGPQLLKVLDFRKQLEETRQVMYRYVGDGERDFLNEVDKHLRAYTKGELSRVQPEREVIVLPLDVLAEVKRAKEQARQQAKQASEAKQEAEAAYLKLQELQLQMAEDAALLAKEGLLEHAREKFNQLLNETSHLRILYLAYEFFYWTGELETAERLLKQWLEISGEDNHCVETAAAQGYLGVLYQTQGDFRQAETLYRKALVTNEMLGNKEGMASQYGNLGNLYSICGKLTEAELMYCQSLEINKELGDEKGMAIQYEYGNLGINYQK